MKLVSNSSVNIQNALTPINDCDCYCDIGKSNMSKCATFILDAIDKVRDSVVQTETLTGEIEDLHVIIDDVTYHHNMMMIFASSDVMRYIKRYLSIAVADNKKEVLESTKIGTWERIMDMNIGGNGYGTAVVCHYDSIWFGIQAV